jgi:surface polysaccharide O-acyltransferase-like enzyme
MAMPEPCPVIVAVAPAAGSPRYHALDSVRAVMMLLGIYLHAVVAYAPIGGWPYKQLELTNDLNFTVILIHVFRMPVFYVMAGFFAALLYERRGFRLAVENRVWRILIPLVVGWCIIFPLVMLLVGPVKFGWAYTLESFASGDFLLYAHPLHLWFLEYLLVLYALTVVAFGAIRALFPAGALDAANRLFRAALGSYWAPVLFAVPSFFALLPMRYAGFDDPPSFVPAPRIVIAYAIPFVFGWLLYLNTDLIGTLRRRCWPYALAALVPIAFYLRLVPLPTELQPLPFAVRCAIHSLSLWLLIFAILGLFDRYLSGCSRTMRYVCDSSYFLYLAHMPVLLVFQVLLLQLDIAPLLKIPIALAATVAVLLVMYRYGVRPTVIGAVLNGRRYPVRDNAVLVAAGAQR